MNRLKMLVVSLLMMPFVVHAHPGMNHSGGWLDGVIHLFSSLDHLFPLLIAMMIGGVVWRRVRPQRQQ